MTRLCYLQYEKTMQFTAQQTRVLLCSGIAYTRIRWRSCKVCCAKKHSIQYIFFSPIIFDLFTLFAQYVVITGGARVANPPSAPYKEFHTQYEKSTI